MDVAELQVFLTVASERSFSRAAERLHRTQPAVSQAVRRLEEDDRRAVVRPLLEGRPVDGGRRAPARLRAAPRAAQGGGGRGGARAAGAAAGPGADRRERGRRARPAADRRALPRRAPAGPGRGAALVRPPDPGRGAGTRPGLRGAHVPGARAGASLAAPGGRRAGDADPPGPSARPAQQRDDGGGRAPDRDRPQRGVAGARARAAALRAAAHLDQHPDRAPEPRRHQARGRDGAWRGPAPEALRPGRDSPRAARRRPGVAAPACRARCAWSIGGRAEMSEAAAAFLAAAHAVARES